MVFSSSYPYLPLWLFMPLFFVLLLAAREVGIWLRRRHPRMPGQTAEDDAFAMSSVLGLLALLIGFTFSVALSRYDERRELVVKEANAIGTTWLRTGLLEASDGERMRDVLRRYVDARIAFGGARNNAEERAQFARTGVLQNELWAVMTAGIAGFRDTPRASLIVTTTNESIDLAGERMATREAHIPARILRLLLIFAVLAAGLVGYERARQRKETTLVLLLFALAVSLVIDLDQPSTGVTNVPQTPMLDLKQSMAEAPPALPPR
jgi:FtsH-binding integral membrane protein